MYHNNVWNMKQFFYCIWIHLILFLFIAIFITDEFDRDISVYLWLKFFRWLSWLTTAPDLNHILCQEMAMGKSQRSSFWLITFSVILSSSSSITISRSLLSGTLDKILDILWQTHFDRVDLVSPWLNLCIPRKLKTI